MIDWVKVAERLLADGHMSREVYDSERENGIRAAVELFVHGLRDDEIEKLAAFRIFSKPPSPHWVSKLRDASQNYIAPIISTLALTSMVGSGIGSLAKKLIPSGVPDDVMQALQEIAPTEEDMELALRAYETLRRFAPDIAQDPIATKSMVRHMIQTMKIESQKGSIDFRTLEMLSQTQKNISDVAAKKQPGGIVRRTHEMLELAKDIRGNDR